MTVSSRPASAVAPWSVSGQQVFDEEERGPVHAILQGACATSSSVQRLAHVQGIAAAAEAAEYDDCSSILPLVDELLADGEAEVRLAALLQLAHLGEVMREKDVARSQSDIQHAILPLVLPLALDDHEEVSRQAIISFQQLVALLPRQTAAAVALAAIHRLESRGAEDAAVQAARIFAHTAAYWSETALHERASDLLRRWCSHRDFIVREAIACCMSLIGDHLPVDVWHSALLPWFSQLCRDNNWRVRRAAALDLPRLAGKLNKQQHRVLHRADSTCSCTSDESSACSVCGSTSGACSREGGCVMASAPRCRISGVPVEPLGVVATGLCAQYGSCGGGPAAAARGRYALSARSRSGTAAYAASTVPTVWSAHTLKPSSGAPTSMGKHPLSSSLLVDEPQACDSPASPSSSSLSSTDDRPLAGSLCPASPWSPVAAAEAGVEAAGEAADHAAGEVAEQAAKQTSEAPAVESITGSGAAGGAAAAGAAPPCPLMLDQPTLHACWVALRECVDCLTADSSHWVKVTALSGLGPCLLALPPCQLSSLLIGRFASMGASTTVIYEISVALACAQSYGLVASRLGPQQWPDIRAAFQHLQASRDPAVLQELITVLPVMAHHLGAAVLRDDLVPVLLNIITHHLSWVDGALVGVLASLMEVLPAASHEPLLRVVGKLARAGVGHQRCGTWRLRHGVAAQLGRLARAVQRAAVTDVLWPAAVALCSDPVAAVRGTAAEQMGPLLAALLPTVQQELPPIQENLSFSSSSSRQQQQQEGRQGDSQRPGVLRKPGLPAHPPLGRDQLQRQQRRVNFSKEDVGSDSGGSCFGMDRESSGVSTSAGGSPSGRQVRLCVSYSSSSCGDDGVEGAMPGSSLPCALAAPPCSPPRGEGAQGTPASSHASHATWEEESHSSSSMGDQLTMRGTSSDGHDGDCSSGGSSSESDGETGGRAARRMQPGLPHTPVHPAMAAVHPAMGAVHPAMAPVGTWVRSKLAPKRSCSTGELTSARRRSLDSLQSNMKRNSSMGRLAPSRERSSSCDGSNALMDPLCVSPPQYVGSLVDRFGHGSSFHGRQLFVRMGLSILVAAGKLLPRHQQEKVISTLQALAKDRVLSVRVVAEGAAAALQAVAAELARGGSEGKDALPSLQRQPSSWSAGLQQGDQQGGAAPVRQGGYCSASEDIEKSSSCEGEGRGRNAGGGVGIDVPPASEQRMLQAARALAQGQRSSSVEAASAALCTRHAMCGTPSPSVPVAVSAFDL